ncbi:MAG: O-antigen ligase family protein [Thermoguttaceae bacterium]
MPLLSFILAAVVLTSGEFAWQTGNIHIVAVLAALAAAWVAVMSPSFRWRIVDAVVFAFLAVMALASLAHLTRFSLNTVSISVTGAAVWFLARQSLTTPSRMTFCLVLLTSLIAAEAVAGLDQVYREFPEQQRSFEADPDTARRQLGIATDAEWMLLVNRLRTAEPTGTYALTNTLGGTLAVGVILVCGFFVAILVRVQSADGADCRRFLSLSGSSFFSHTKARRHKGSFSSSILFAPLCLCVRLIKNLCTSAKSADRPNGHHIGNFVLVAFAATVLIVLATCLVATHSRSAMVACGVAAAWGVLVLAKRRVVRIGLVAFGLFCVIAILVASEGARRSLMFRAEYWRATASMIADAPLLGCGAGNFQHRYTRYKLPEASEEIADPHNWLLEVAACGGIPAAVLFLGVLVLLGRELVQWQPVTPPEYRLRFPLPMRDGVAAFLGGIVALAASYATELPMTLVVLVPLVLLLPLAVWTSNELSRRQIFVSDGLLVAVMIVLLVHLAAAGGVMYTNTQAILWICGAIIVNRRCCMQETVQTNRSFDAKKLLRAAPWCVAVVVIYWVNFLPVTESLRFLAAASMAKRPSDERVLIDAARRADSLSTNVALAELAFAERAWATKPNDESLRAILAAAERLTKLAPESAKLRMRAGESLSAAANVARDENAARAKLRYYAYLFVEEAAERYPTSASLQASRAVVLSHTGHPTLAAEAAEIALALDAATPHADQKLTPQQRAKMKEVLAKPKNVS